MDFGYRVVTEDGKSFNAKAANDNHIKGRKETCQSCGANRNRARSRARMRETRNHERRLHP